MTKCTTNFYVCLIEWYDYDEHESHKEYALFNAQSYADCSTQIEEFYGEDNVTSMFMFALETGPIQLPKMLAETLMDGDLNDLFGENMSYPW